MLSFDDAYARDGDCTDTSREVPFLHELEDGAAGLMAFCSTHAGCSFERGLYRIHSAVDMPIWTKLVTEAFPVFRKRVFCFSYDWLGRHFALDLLRKERGQYLILMMDPGTGEALEIPADFNTFHQHELVQFRNEALAVDFFRAWLASYGPTPSSSECVGYKKPLFLGGRDDVDNLELIDMEVYWSLSSQLLQKIQGLPEGTPINDLRLED